MEVATQWSRCSSTVGSLLASRSLLEEAADVEGVFRGYESLIFDTKPCFQPSAR